MLILRVKTPCSEYTQRGRARQYLFSNLSINFFNYFSLVKIFFV
ncbi:hypothetical protein RICGR_0939 [Rickettsiella grylli]|uniref:Uncharacterized protein n=1 Tax=Rickettsiella grylli TaxID=59196 RepID=A8PN90_9COXI|nr:hypothetical protein RICGR_0939 [Rickettsiella grylli]